MYDQFYMNSVLILDWTGKLDLNFYRLFLVWKMSQFHEASHTWYSVQCSWRWKNPSRELIQKKKRYDYSYVCMFWCWGNDIIGCMVYEFVTVFSSRSIWGFNEPHSSLHAIRFQRIFFVFYFNQGYFNIMYFDVWVLWICYDDMDLITHILHLNTKSCNCIRI